MLRWRLAAAAAILIPLISLLVLDFRWNGGIPGIWLIVPGLVIALAATAEVLDLIRLAGAQPLNWTAHLGVVLVFLAAFRRLLPGGGEAAAAADASAELGLILAAQAVAVVIAFLGEMHRFQAPGGAIVNLAASVFTIVYVGFALSFAALLRQFHSNAWGMAALISVIFIIKWSDTGAYFCGKAWGRRKLSPRLSPGKTWEGVAGGLAVAALASWGYFRFLTPWLTGDAAYVPSVSGTVAYGVALGLVGLAGDLGESLLKRDAQQKDSSRWLPGLGGVLDVLDSLIFAMPLAYACWSLGLVGP